MALVSKVDSLGLDLFAHKFQALNGLGLKRIAGSPYHTPRSDGVISGVFAVMKTRTRAEDCRRYSVAGDDGLLRYGVLSGNLAPPCKIRAATWGEAGVDISSTLRPVKHLP